MAENKYKIFSIGLIIILAVLIFQPNLVSAESAPTASGTPSTGTPAAGAGSNQSGGIVPCGNGDTPCTLCDLMQGILNLIEWGLAIVFTVATAGIVIAGIMYIISTGNEGMMTQAKGFLTAALVGFFIVLGAWLIVNVTLTWILPSDIGYVTNDKNAKWYKIDKLNCGSNTANPSASGGSGVSGGGSGGGASGGGGSGGGGF